MADYNSSLPVRTESPGDIASKIVDATVPSQGLAVDSSGLIGAKTYSGSGTSITSTGSALDVNLKTSSITLPVSGTVTANQGTANTIGNAWPVKPTDGTNSQSFTAAGEAKVDITQPIPAGSNIIGSVGVTNLPTTVDTNYGAAGASTIRTASQIGNSTGAASFNNGATSAQTLRVAANLALSGTDVSSSNPIPVSVSSVVPGTAVQSYQTSASLAVNGTANLQYTVTAGKTLSLARVWSSASGKIKVVVGVETGVATGIFTTKFVGFNSTATPNIDMTVVSALSVAAGVRVQVAITNRDNQAEDVYTTIEGTEN